MNDDTQESGECLKRHVWTIEDGDYSDYHIVGIFSSRENAEMVHRRVGGEIVQKILDPHVWELSQGYRLYKGVMLRDGTVETMVEVEMDQFYEESDLQIFNRSHRERRPDCLSGRVLAKDHNHAVKIFNEIRTRFIAQNMWN